jgi:hypothetical protein
MTSGVIAKDRIEIELCFVVFLTLLDSCIGCGRKRVAACTHSCLRVIRTSWNDASVMLSVSHACRHSYCSNCNWQLSSDRTNMNWLSVALLHPLQCQCVVARLALSSRLTMRVMSTIRQWSYWRRAFAETRAIQCRIGIVRTKSHTHICMLVSVGIVECRDCCRYTWLSAQQSDTTVVVVASAGAAPHTTSVCRLQVGNKSHNWLRHSQVVVVWMRGRRFRDRGCRCSCIDMSLCGSRVDWRVLLTIDNLYDSLVHVWLIKCVCTNRLPWLLKRERDVRTPTSLQLERVSRHTNRFESERQLDRYRANYLKW